MLISKSDIVSLAYITNIDDNLIKDEVINMVIQTYLVPVLTEAFYNEIMLDPNSYTALINTYIKPCIAFYVKYHLYTQQLFETAQYSSPDPSKSPSLFSPAISALIPNSVNRSVLRDIRFIAWQKEQLLRAHLISTTYDHYVKPSSNRICGFIVPP
jgi:hypothetical protein